MTEQQIKELSNFLKRSAVKHFYCAKNILNDEFHAHDAVQEAWIRIINNYKHEKTEIRNLEAWALTVVKNTAINELHKIKRFYASIAVNIDNEELTYHESFISADAKLLSVDKEDQMRPVYNRIRAILTPCQFDFFFLRHIEGLASAEIASLKGIATETVIDTLSNARRKIKRNWPELHIILTKMNIL